MNLEEYCQSKGISINLPIEPEKFDTEIFISKETFEPIKETWDVEGVESFFQKTELPTKPIKLNQCSTIINIETFIESHLDISKAHNGIPVYKPYFERLIQLREILRINNFQAKQHQNGSFQINIYGDR